MRARARLKLFIWVLWPPLMMADMFTSLADPCHFPSPQMNNFPALCQHHYHRVGYVCDPLATLSRTEAELLSQQFNNFSIQGCVDCEKTERKECISFANRLRISLLIVPFTTLKKIENCGMNRLRENRVTSTEAPRIYAEIVKRNWMEMGCDADITILYIGSLQYSHSSRRPIIVRIFSNKYSHLSHLPAVHFLSANIRPFEALRIELNQSLSIAQIDSVEAESFMDSPKTKAGVPMWAFGISAFLLILVIICTYLGSCVTKRFNIRAQQKKFNNRSMAAAAAGVVATERWRANGAPMGATLTSSGPTSNPQSNNSMMANMAVQNTKSSMMFRQFGLSAKKQKAAASGNLQKI